MKIIILLFLTISVFSQTSPQYIYFENPSLEEKPAPGQLPLGWESCLDGSTPDILPGFWGVTKKAQDGDSYLGLITRKDGTFESIGHRLSQPMKANTCYQMDFYLAKSANYENYSNPIRLRIKGGNTACDSQEVLYESDLVMHEEWKKYWVGFSSKQDVDFLIFEVTFAKGVIITYRGNLLIDNLSPIKKCSRA